MSQTNFYDETKSATVQLMGDGELRAFIRASLSEEQLRSSASVILQNKFNLVSGVARKLLDEAAEGNTHIGDEDRARIYING